MGCGPLPDWLEHESNAVRVKRVMREDSGVNKGLEGRDEVFMGKMIKFA